MRKTYVDFDKKPSGGSFTILRHSQFGNPVPIELKDDKLFVNEKQIRLVKIEYPRSHNTGFYSKDPNSYLNETVGSFLNSNQGYIPKYWEEYCNGKSPRVVFYGTKQKDSTYPYSEYLWYLQRSGKKWSFNGDCIGEFGCELDYSAEI